ELLQHVVAPSRESIDASRLGPLRFLSAQPPTLRHTREDGVQSSRTQAVAVMVQLLEHPLSVDAASIGGVIEDVNLPERQQEFPRNRVAHHRGMIASRIRNRKTILIG